METRIKLFAQIATALIMGSLGLIALHITSNEIVEIIKYVIGEETYENPAFQRILVLLIVLIIMGLTSIFPGKVSPSHFNLIV